MFDSENGITESAMGPENGFVERLMKAFGTTQDKELAARLSIAPSTISNWRARRNIPVKRCIEFSRRFGISMDWLMFGVGEATRAAAAQRYGVDEQAIRQLQVGPTLAPLRLYDTSVTPVPASLSVPGIAGLYLEACILEHEAVAAEQVVAVRVFEPCMLPTLHDGQCVIVELGTSTPDGVFLLRMDDRLRVRRVLALANGGWRLISDNPRYGDEYLPLESLSRVEILGRVRLGLARIA